MPLPLAACAALALVLSPLAFGARPWARGAVAPAAASTESGAAAAPPVRVVEVPVVQERVVTQVVYVEKKERGRGRVVPSQAAGGESLAAGQPPARSVGAGHAEARHVEARADAPETEAPPADASAGYFTRVNMEDFQPANEVKVRILKRGSVDEK